MFAQLVVSGITHGAIYALVALGMTVVFRATTLVNFGHGDFLMAGAYAVYVFLVSMGLPYAVAVPLGLALLFACGYAIQSVLIRPILSAPHLTLAMMGIAAGYALRGLAQVYAGQSMLQLPSVYPSNVYSLGGIIITSGDLIITGGVLGLLALLLAAFYMTPLGKLALAVFQSSRGAALVGINVPRFHAIMWGVGATLGALGGILIAPTTLLYPDMSAWVLVRGFAAMALGGFGSMPGAVLGAFLLGISELLLGFYASTVFVEITPYLVIIFVLLLRPAGLFGRREVARV